MAWHILLSGKIWRICSDCLRDNRQLMAGEAKNIYIYIPAREVKRNNDNNNNNNNNSNGCRCIG